MISRALLFLLFLFSIAHAEIPVPKLSAPVTDLTGTLNEAEKTALDQKLLAFGRRKGSQIGVLIVPTTKPEEIAQYGIRVADEWKLGRKHVDDGAILIVAKDDRRLRIEVGYGLEGVLNDATARRIVSEVIVPRFARGDFYGGIDAGVDKMMSVIEGEPLPAPPAAQEKPHEGLFPLAFFFLLFLAGVLRAVLGRLPGAFVAAGIMGILVWVTMGALFIAIVAAIVAFLFTLFGGGRGVGPFGGFMGGRGGRGMGGYSGGGGGFGGGGASGRW